MGISNKNLGYLEFIRDIYEVSGDCSTKTYIWGGFTIDIFEGKFLREHNDLDAFTENMLVLVDDLIIAYEKRGYQVTFLKDIHMLKVGKGALHASFNRLEVDGEVAMWKHIGDEGTVYFPTGWLDRVARDFYDTKVYTPGICFEYAIKTNVRMLNAEWQPREKDRVAITYLNGAIRNAGISKDEIYKRVWSYNPYWAKRGYDEYALPIVAYPLEPR